uniref:Retrovirus-related Pol polyprotein from transposon TNT 1-94 n=1 Tax=Tanacetum cinerariifolium TaxID=118510 RepID=A0A699KKY7_TANCI|nr:retrovirus-related Pol polyprotein from transposon TNT 1-94 [Tanacetum cinerariifolium]
MVSYKKKLLDQASIEKQDLMAKLENEKSMNAKWLSTSKNLHKLVGSSMTARTKRGLWFTKVNHYKGVPPPMNGNYMPTSTSPDTDESPRPYGKQTSESTKIKSTSKNYNFPFDFSDRSLVPTASDSCVESARPKFRGPRSMMDQNPRAGYILVVHKADPIHSWLGSPRYLKPFGCQVTILNTSDYLGKFDEKADEGYIVGYSIPGKAYRVYNLVTGKIVETMNMKFLENLPSVEGTCTLGYLTLIISLIL